MIELPKKTSRPRDLSSTKRQFAYREVITNNIPLNQVWSVILSKKDLDLDMDKLIELINSNRALVSIWCLDYESVTFLDKILKEKVSNPIILVDDGLRISRDYIDLTKLNNIKVCIPLTYLMWGIKFNDTVDTYCGRTVDQNSIRTSGYNNSNKNISLEDLKKIKSTLQNLARYNPKDVVEKVYLVSDYIQSRTQFIEESETESTRGIFITPTCSGTNSGHVETVNNKGYGVCAGIANLSTLLLNNPLLCTETESVFGDHHVWNKVLIDGKYYYFDTTWNVTRSDNPADDSLITLSFQRKYLLFGTNTALNIGHHIQQCSSVYNNGVMSEEDYQKVVAYSSRFSYNQTPGYKSLKKKQP